MFRLLLLSAAIGLISYPISTLAQIPNGKCSAPIKSAVVEANFIDSIYYVADEKTCDKLCQDEQNCTVYTFYPNNGDGDDCFLLTHLENPVEECFDDMCVTGLPNCEGSICAFVKYGEMFPQGILVTGLEMNVELLTLGTCPSSVAVAIGGGGRGYFGGGGSGYLNDTTNLFDESYVKMVAHPGGRREDSYVRYVAEDNRDIVRGGRGQDVEILGEDGGAGYSGGGGYGYGSGGGGGGSNGAKGEDGADGVGGAGSGVRIDDIPVTNFALSPGEGGVSTITSYGGGGGGGVLIDGQGPDRPLDRVGEGYGGGGSTDYVQVPGLPGAVILDFVPEQ